MTPKDPVKMMKTAMLLGDELDKVWKRTYNVKQMLRDNSRKSFEKRFKPYLIHYEIGDFVLVSIKDHTRHRKKTKLNWIGPYIVSQALGPYLYEVTDCEDKAIMVHSCRLRFYDDPDYEPSELVYSVFLHNRGEFLLNQVINVAFKEGRYWLLCSWMGLEDNDNTWEPLEEIYDQHRELVIRYLQEHRNNQQVESLLLHLLASDTNKEA